MVREKIGAEIPRREILLDPVSCGSSPRREKETIKRVGRKHYQGLKKHCSCDVSARCVNNEVILPISAKVKFPTPGYYSVNCHSLLRLPFWVCHDV